MSRKGLWRVGSLMGLLLVSVSLSTVQAQTDNPLPAPTGKYRVGVQWRHWVDESREETLDEAPHGKREMMVELLYPAEAPANG